MSEHSDASVGRIRAQEQLNRMLDIALDGGPTVDSARGMAEMHDRADDKKPVLKALVRSTAKSVVDPVELSAVAVLLDPAAEFDAETRTALAQWTVYARLATAVALVHDRDPGHDWVRTGISLAIHSTPAEQILKRVRRAQRRRRMEEAIDQIPPEVLEEIFVEIAKVILSDPGSRRPGTKGPKSRGPKSGGPKPRGPQSSSFKAAGRRGFVFVVRRLPSVIADRIWRWTDRRQCRRVGEHAWRVFRCLSLPPPTDAVAAR